MYLFSCLLAVTVTQIQVNGDGDFKKIFDGKSLSGWRCVPESHQSDWSVSNGVITGRGSKDKLVYLVWKEEELADFELKLKYRLLTKGNSGVEIRARVDKSGKRPFEGYHADFGHVGIGKNVLGAWDFHFAKRKEYACNRGTNLTILQNGRTERSEIKNALTTKDIKSGDWNDLQIVANGSKMSFSINGKTASQFTDHMPERLKSGMIGLQIHDAGMVVQFKDIYLKKKK